MYGAEENSPSRKQGQVPLEDYFKVHRVREASFSFDNRFIAYLSDRSGRMEVWRQPVEGGEPQQLTKTNGVIHAFAFSPVDNRLLYEVDDGGNDETRLFITDILGGTPVALFPGAAAGSRYGYLRWAEDGQSVLYISNLPKEDFTTIARLALRTGASTSLLKSTDSMSPVLESRDFSRIILQEIRSDLDSDLYLWEPKQEKPRLLTHHSGPVAYTPYDFSKDGSALYYTSTEGAEYTRLYAMDLNTGVASLVRGGKWDVESASVSPQGDLVTFTVNAGGTSASSLYDPKTKQETSLPNPLGYAGGLVPVSFSPSERWVAETLVSDTAPESEWLLDRKTGQARILEKVLPESLESRTFVAGEEIEFASFDGLKIPGLLYRPRGKGPFPAIVDVHGGPQSQAKRVFSGFRQYMVSKGYVVLAPNVRGSTGYGKTFSSLDDMDLGGAPLRDVVAAKRWLVSNASVDPARVAILGASYGGYMALAAATFAPTEFAVHIDYFGISDFKRLLASYPAYWAVYSSWTYKKYGDPKTPEGERYQHDRSPINFVDRIERPILIVQGENDPHVPRAQSESVVKALRDRGKPVEFLLLAHEGHGFSDNGNRLNAYRRTEAFLSRYLAPSGSRVE